MVNNSVQCLLPETRSALSKDRVSTLGTLSETASHRTTSYTHTSSLTFDLPSLCRCREKEVWDSEQVYL